MQLALETSTHICSVAFKDARGEVHEKRTEVKGSHSEQLFLFIEELMQTHEFSIDELESMIVSEGPGSYTGLRISASAVKGLLFQTGVPLFAANTLASFAAAAIEGEPELVTIHSIIDARRVHVYHQQFEYESGNLSSSGEVKVIPIKQFEKLVKPGQLVIGTGLERLDRKIGKQADVVSSSQISARSLLKLYELDTQKSFLNEAEAQLFEPKYYSSNQV